MRERGDLSVLHEPFMYDYYIAGGRGEFAGFEPEADHPRSYPEIRDMILRLAAETQVFLKDMGYYVVDTLSQDPKFARQMHHAFLIRDPAESVVSYARRQRDFSLEEVGLEAQWRLYQALRDMGLAPIVLSADAIRQNPAAEMGRYWKAAGLPDCANALSWDDTVPAGWRAVDTWHLEVMETNQILPPDPGRNTAAELATLGPPFTDHVSHHRPFYDLLLAESQSAADNR